MARIMIVEDDATLLHLLGAALRGDGHDVVLLSDGKAALEHAREEEPDLVLLDVMLPGLSGWEVCRRLREESDVAIVMLTALGDDNHEIRGLNYGADDYVTKPFSLAALRARIRACLRRTRPVVGHGMSEGTIRLNGLTVRPNERRVTVDGRRVQLTRQEFELLCFLVNHPDRVFSREHLLHTVWSYDYAGDTHTVSEHVSRLRKKLDPERSNRFIETVWGVGYRFRAEDEE